MADGLNARMGRAVEGLAPGYFALVMATGIISVGMSLEGFVFLSRALLGVGVGAFGVLLCLTLWRFAAYRFAVVEDFTDPRRGLGFFTFVAATNVLGVRAGLAGHDNTTAILLALSGLAWLALGYTVPWTAILGRRQRPVMTTVNGDWFLTVVATQSVAVAAATIEPVFDPARHALAVLAIVSWSLGVFGYAAVGILVTIRLTTYELDPTDLTPPYWVSMGAAAITVLAAARIVEMTNAPMVAITRNLVAGLAVMFWGLATWLIPALVAAGWWRHIRRRIPLRYDATLWSIIFPLGMYAVAGIYLGKADRLPVVNAVGSAELWAAFAACTVALVAMSTHIYHTVLRPGPAREQSPN